MRFIVQCEQCGNDIVITPGGDEVNVIGSCKTPIECGDVFMAYTKSGLAEKDYNMLAMLFPEKKNRYSEVASYYTTQIVEMLDRLRVEHRVVVEGNIVKVWINADSPHHVSLQ